MQSKVWDEEGIQGGRWRIGEITFRPPDRQKTMRQCSGEEECS